MADLSIATCFMSEEFKLHILKWSSDDTIVVKHNAES